MGFGGLNLKQKLKYSPPNKIRPFALLGLALCSLLDLSKEKSGNIFFASWLKLQPKLAPPPLQTKNPVYVPVYSIREQLKGTVI